MKDPAYIIVDVFSTDDFATTKLAEEVNKKIAAGYKPLGQPFIHEHAALSTLCQAMIMPVPVPN